MKLQRQLSRMVGNTYYPKWTVVIPPDMIKQAGWRVGQELEAEIRGKNITLKPKT
ncbi:MAG: AbrB/MazE/SpoVT family DNA-binding domain-containing protein [Nitrosopumilaceae archaeon]